MKPQFSVDAFPQIVLQGLTGGDRKNFSIAVAQWLAGSLPEDVQGADFERTERLVPIGYHKYFFYAFGSAVAEQHNHEFSKRVAAVEFLRNRPEEYRLALAGLLSSWSREATIQTNNDLTAGLPLPIGAELRPHYWRAIGCLDGRRWLDSDRTPHKLDEQVQAVLPNLDPSVRTYFLQGVGESLFEVPPRRHGIAIRNFPEQYQQDLLTGWGMALGNFELSSNLPWRGEDSPYWPGWSKGLSLSNVQAIQEGKAQFENLFDVGQSDFAQHRRIHVVAN